MSHEKQNLSEFDILIFPKMARYEQYGKKYMASH